MNFDKIDNLVKEVLDSPKVDVTKWKRFKIGELFNITRGKRIVKNRDFFVNIDDKMIFPVITAKTKNNGIDGYYNRTNCDANHIVCCGEVSGMFCTWQENKCWVLDTCRIFNPMNFILNKHIALFLMTLMMQHMNKFSYQIKATPDKIKELEILIPVDKNNNPNWQYMENFIKSRERYEKSVDFSRLENLPKEIRESKIINITNWQNFKIGNLFNCYGSKYLSSKNFNYGNTPFLSKSIFNNGVEKFVDHKNCRLSEGNCITIGDHSAIAFYQSESFLTSDHLTKMYLINGKLTKNIALFICSVFNILISSKYGYKHIFGKNLAKQTFIPLPSKNNQPDWEYMENYIKKRWNQLEQVLLN